MWISIAEISDQAEEIYFQKRIEERPYKVADDANIFRDGIPSLEAFEAVGIHPFSFLTSVYVQTLKTILFLLAYFQNHGNYQGKPDCEQNSRPKAVSPQLKSLNLKIISY